MAASTPKAAPTIAGLHSWRAKAIAFCVSGTMTFFKIWMALRRLSQRLSQALTPLRLRLSRPLPQGERGTTERPMPDTYDLIVLGSGPGGYVAAIRAAQL